jgi:uncharacterized protein YggU (UPF0235/DUF167 family)
VRVAALPERGKANEMLMEVLREWLGAHGVEIVAGLSRPEKTVRVPGLSTIPDL